MALFLSFLFLALFPMAMGESEPPNPGYSLSSRYPSLGFKRGFKTLWGTQNQRLQGDTLTMWLDKSSGSGFVSKYSYSAGYLEVKMKLPHGYTAGTDTSIYLSSTRDYSKKHDELDIEFLGNVNGKPYVLQTNVLTSQSTGADGYTVGREMQFELWFDPTQDFHTYAILWNPKEILFFVDDVPIRQYPNVIGLPFVSKRMWAFGSIWDASSWATENGLYKADYHFSPFVAQYNDVKIFGCHNNRPTVCRHRFSASPTGSFGLSRDQLEAMRWVQKNYMIYNYCTDPTRGNPPSPECYRRRQ